MKTASVSLKIDDLVKERAKIDKQINELSKLETDVSFLQLDGFTVEEKCRVFDFLHERSVDYLNRRISGGECEVEDDPRYIFETVLMKCLGKDIFRFLNKLPD